jgi:steroid delta-isomerase-like uncharacterized protein
MPTPSETDAATVRARIVAANDATYAAWNAHDADAVAAVFAETAVVRDLGNPDVARGRDAVRERARALLAAFPDFSLERVELLVDEAGNANADRWVARGTHRGEFLGLAATGRTIEVEGMTISRFDPVGAVIDDVNAWDVGALLAQLGGD